MWHSSSTALPKGPSKSNCKTINPSHRNFGLDVVRALAISLVLVSHLVVWGIEEMAPQADWLHRLGWLSQISGILGVELFFVLSGFLVGGLILKERTSLMHFYMRRWLRTLPAYFAVLLLLVLLKPLPENAWRYFLFVQPGMNDFFSVSWTLSIEEWFYLAVPLILLLPRRYFCFYLLAAILLTCLLRSFSEMEMEQMRRFTPFRMDALLFGVLLVWIKRERPQYYHLLGHAPILILLGIPVIILGGLSAAVRISGYYVAWFETPLFSALLFTLLPLLLALFLPLAEKIPVLPGKIFITTLSIGSYSLYLVHQEIFLLLRTTPLKESYLGWLVGLLLACAAAFVLYQGIERPFMRYRERKWPRQS